MSNKIDPNFDEKRFEKELSQIDKNGKLFNFNICKINDKLKLKVDIFPEWYEHFDNSDYDFYFKTYIPKIMFKYYLLIEKSFYKEFKDIYFYMKGLIYDGDDFRYNEGDSVENIIKFIKGRKNKKIIYNNGDKYIKLKLRAYTNQFLPSIILVPNNKDNTYYNFIKKISKMDKQILKLLIKPIKEKYSNILTLGYVDYVKIKTYKSINLSDNLILDFHDMDINYIYIKNKFNNTFKKNRYLDDSIDIILNKEKVFFDKNKYKILYGYCNLTNIKTEKIIAFKINVYIPKKLVE